MIVKDLEDLSEHMTTAHKKPEATIKCNQCDSICQDRKELNKHMRKDHETYKPCLKFKDDKCEAIDCRFRHIKLKVNEEICYKCGYICTSKTNIINHIKDAHGNEICHKSVSNQCSRSREQCLYKHPIQETTPRSQKQGFWPGLNPPLHSPTVGMLNMSENIQNKLQVQKPQVIKPLQVNILEMIPQIVAQVLVILTQQANP